MTKPAFQLPTSYSFNWNTKDRNSDKSSSGIVKDGGRSQEIESVLTTGQQGGVSLPLQAKRIEGRDYINIEPLIDGDQQEDWVLIEPEAGADVDPKAIKGLKEALSAQNPGGGARTLHKAKDWSLQSIDNEGSTYSALLGKRQFIKLVSGLGPNQSVPTARKV
jgi:hypothetical protein